MMRIRFGLAASVLGGAATAGGIGALVVACGTGGSAPSRPGNGTDASTSDAAPDSSADSALDAGVDVTQGPTACGTLDPATAAQLVLAGFDRVVTPSVAAFSMVDQSPTLARAVSIGSSGSVTLVSSTLNAIAKLRSSLSDTWLVPANVVATDAGAVTYSLPASVVCGDAGTGGTPNGGDAGDGGTDCATQLAAHPQMIRVSRVECDAGDNVEVDWLYDADQKLLLGVELDSARVDVRAFLGTLLAAGGAITETATSAFTAADGGSTTTSTTTTLGGFDPGATGTLVATSDLSGTVAHLVVSVPQAVAISWDAGGAPGAIGVASTAAAVDVTADPDAGTLHGTLGVGDVSVGTTLSSFIQSSFGRSLVSSANPNDPVRVDVAGFTGGFAYDRGAESLQATGLGFADGSAEVIHGSDVLLRVDVAPDAGGAASFTASAPSADSGVDVTFTPGFLLAIRYALASVASQVDQLQAFASDDLLTIALSGAAQPSATLWPAPDGGGNALNLVSPQTGALVSVASGQLSITSTFAPDAGVTVPAPHCLVRTPGQPGVHDILKDLSSADCP